MRSVRSRLVIEFAVTLAAGLVFIWTVMWVSWREGVMRITVAQLMERATIDSAVVSEPPPFGYRPPPGQIQLLPTTALAALKATPDYVVVYDSAILQVFRSSDLKAKIAEAPDPVKYEFKVDTILKNMITAAHHTRAVFDTALRKEVQSRAVRSRIDTVTDSARRELILDSITRAVAQRVPPTSPPAVGLLLGEEVLWTVRESRGPMTSSYHVVVGMPIQDNIDAADIPGGTILFIGLAIIVAGAIVTAYTARGAFRDLNRIRDDLTAITDGRSLHKRLASEGIDNELVRLVTTLNAMLARLEGSFTALRRFTADASHELKTPLTVLRTDIERAMSDRTPSAERLVALEEALHETTRMADLVESLLTLARADEGRYDIFPQPVNLGALVHDVYETASILGEGAGVAVHLPFTTDVTVMGDPVRLRQLFLNLVTNAIKYTPRGGRVDLGLGKHEDHVAFAVRDTGVGISAADIPHVFERFWRADRARSRAAEAGGFGLGLAISQWIVQAHGGTITVSSRLGQGTLFTVTLPLPAVDRAAKDDGEVKEA